MTNPEGYRAHITMPIRYVDLDTLGHVNNSVYMSFMEQARIAYFQTLNIWDGAPGEAGVIVARMVCDYKVPLLMADKAAVVWTRVNRLGNKSFDLEYTLTRETDGVLVATGLSVCVAFNYVENQPIVMPQAWRDTMIDYEPALIE